MGHPNFEIDAQMQFIKLLHVEVGREYEIVSDIEDKLAGGRGAINSEGRHISRCLKACTYYHHLQIDISLLHIMGKDNV